MDWLNRKIDNRVAWPVIIAAICIAVALPALAGTMYSWRTRDGSQAFTDDPKRIPARYRDEAESRPMGHLEDYSRYTPSEVSTEEPYAKRLEKRLEHLRKLQVERAPGETAAADDLRLGVRVGRDHIELPLATQGDEPTVIEEVRLAPDSMHVTTRHAVKIRRGDRLIAVRKNERNDTAPRDWPDDPAPDPDE